MTSKFTFGLLFLFIINFLSAQFNNPKNLPFTWKTDIQNKSVNLSEITIVLPKGTFPKIDYPNFNDKSKGLKSFLSKEPVIAVAINGEAKAYPLNMLTIHEISNDILGGVPILPTYCPLCNASVVYNRNVTHKGKKHLLEFEVSGMLRNSDMVMLDKATETLWQQFTGEAIVGDFNGAVLEIIPSIVISVEEFFNRYPDGKILSKSNGNERAKSAYGSNYYTKYDSENGKPYNSFFRSDKIDKRLPPMERVVDVESKGDYKIYPFSLISKKGVINDRFKAKEIVIFYKKGVVSILDQAKISESKDIGSVTVFNRKIGKKLLSFITVDGLFIDNETKSKWDLTGRSYEGKLKGSQLNIEPHSNHFAFAFLAFHPKAEIYTK